MWLTRQAIDRPFLLALLTAALLLAGFFSWRRMPVDLNPQADLPNVIVTAVYPGAAPTAVEQLLCKPLEDAVRGVSGVTHVFSVSQENFGYLYVEFREGTNIDKALESCREAVGAIRANLPEEVREPAFARLDINAQPVVFLGLTGQRPLEELRRLADDVLKPRLKAVDGVSDVAVLGGRSTEVQIQVDRNKLLANQLTMSSLIDPLKGSSGNLPGGRVENGDQEQTVRLIGQFRSLDDIRNAPIPPSLDPGAMMQAMMRRTPPREPTRALRFGDLATVSRVAVDPEVRIRLAQRQAVGVVVTKQGNGNTVRISREVHAALAGAPLPKDVHIEIARDTAQTVHEALSDVDASIIVGILLCALAIYIFLRNWHGTLIVATSIPVCLLGTFALMAFGGNTLNQMTLLGLALSVGILVDDSIVCLEAIAYRLQRGEPAADAAFNGRNDIALADTSTTLIDLAVFVPIAVMHGVVGQFFRDFGFVVAAAAGLSLLAAYTVVPALSASWYRHHPPHFGGSRTEQWMTSLEVRYRAALRWALRHRRWTLLIGWSVLLLTGFVAWLGIGIDFIPAADLSTVVINVERPAGSTLDATERVVSQAEQTVSGLREVKTIFSTIGRIESGFGIVNRVGPQYAQISVTLSDRRSMLDRLLFRGGALRNRSDSAVADELRDKLSGMGDARWQVIAVHGWGGAGAPVDFSIYGQDLDQMAALGEVIQRRLDQVPGLLNVDMSWRLGQPEVQVRVDRNAARDLLVYPGAVARELRTCLEGETGTTIDLGGELVPVRLRLREFDRRDAADVARIPVGRTDARMVTVADVARVVQGTGPTRIDRRDGLRDLNFKAYLGEGVSLGDVQKPIEALLRELGVPFEKAPVPAHAKYPQLRWGWRGDAETLADSAGSMAWTAILGLLLTYGVMAALFNSAVHPLTILLSVPMAIAGALLALVLTGSSMSIVSGIGMILLIGIVVRNAILLIDHILQLRREGMPRGTAVEESGVRRLRPILMTTLATIFGMLPVAMKIGKGAEIRAPMAIAVIGGLILSTLLTLLIVPVTYTILDDWKRKP